MDYRGDRKGSRVYDTPQAVLAPASALRVFVQIAIIADGNGAYFTSKWGHDYRGPFFRRCPSTQNAHAVTLVRGEWREMVSAARSLPVEIAAIATHTTAHGERWVIIAATLVRALTAPAYAAMPANVQPGPWSASLTAAWSALLESQLLHDDQLDTLPNAEVDQ